jgi:DNA-binding NarL/FixJ family response regulator
LARGPAEAGEGLLSPREQEILTLVAEARTNRDIARRLYISEATVKRHLANAYSKLGAASRMEAVHLAAAAGIFNRGHGPGHDLDPHPKDHGRAPR